MSCDLLPTDKPGPHYQGDVRGILGDGWDLMIAHPDCTYLCSSGLHWNNRGRGWEKTEAALDFVRLLMAAPIEKIAIENPMGCIGTKIRKADQYIQPYQFGHDASKRTGLWLKNLAPLRHSAHTPPVTWTASQDGTIRRTAGRTSCRLPKIAGRFGQKHIKVGRMQWPINGADFFMYLNLTSIK